MSKKESFIVRDFDHDDRNFIMSTMLKSLYYGDSWFTRILKNIFMTNYHRLLQNIFTNKKVTIKVACLSDAKDVILGYAIYRDQILDYVYVKQDWRKIGIAKTLIPTNISQCSHLTKVGEAIIKSKASHIVYNPFV